MPQEILTLPPLSTNHQHQTYKKENWYKYKTDQKRERQGKPMGHNAFYNPVYE